MKTLVIGAGTMGHGIAQVVAMAGHPVTLTDVDAAALERARASIERNLDKGVERGKVSAELRQQTLANIVTEPDLERAAAGAELVVEAIVEKLEIKRALFARLEGLVDAKAILASNTSSLPLTKIAEELAHPERVIGMHFFNPVHIMKLLEVVVHAGTSDATRARVLEIARALGKEPIVVRDSPGFASSRLGVVLGLEAMRMVESDVASAADIDKAMELGYKHPMGPLRLTDLVGLDVRLAIAEALHRELGGAQYEPPQILRDKVARGELGKKSGKGFYDW
ncbi:MAG: 3-hydroxyacyl-CoA dehydrogenase family protein [Myxococcales bacterium]|nr:3-hydroxyacyl-CoA dehydrogenase family protein [Myxococcales bacterium]